MDGVLLVDKPSGLSSAEVVRRIKARVKPARVGHLGTLDPFATGLLPILVGQGTRLAPFLDHGEKEYTGTIALGAETDTLDPSGQVVRVEPVPPLEGTRLAEIAASFVGRIEQVPPVFSAIKRAGVPLYKLARRGGVVEPAAARMVEIAALELEDAGGGALRFKLVCSPGTYVRALARDIGLKLGSAGHLAELRRHRSAGFSLADARALEDMLAALSGDASLALIGMRQALSAMAELVVGEAVEQRVRNGDSSALEGLGVPGPAPFKVIRDGRLLAIAHAEPPGRTRLLRVFAS